MTECGTSPYSASIPTVTWETPKTRRSRPDRGAGSTTARQRHCCWSPAWILRRTRFRRGGAAVSPILCRPTDQRPETQARGGYGRGEPVPSVVDTRADVQPRQALAATYYGLWPDIVYLGSDEPSKNRWLPGDGMFKHGSIVGYMIGDVDVQVINEFQLVLGDPFPPELRSNHEIVTAARKWHRQPTRMHQVISA